MAKQIEHPVRPLLVLATAKGERRKVPHWYYSVPYAIGTGVRFARCEGHDWKAPDRLRVVASDRNDAEAVAIIEGAKRSA